MNPELRPAEYIKIYDTGKRDPNDEKSGLIAHGKTIPSHLSIADLVRTRCNVPGQLPPRRITVVRYDNGEKTETEMIYDIHQGVLPGWDIFYAPTTPFDELHRL